MAAQARARPALRCSGGNRAIGFLRASWAELQRVQWPDRRQVTRPRPWCSASSRSPAPTSAWPTTSAKEIVELIL